MAKSSTLKKIYLINIESKKVLRSLTVYKAYLLSKFQALISGAGFHSTFSELFFSSLYVKKNLNCGRQYVLQNLKFRGYIRLLSYFFIRRAGLTTSKHLIFRFAANNIFLTLVDRKKTLINCSLGTLKIKASKKNLAFVSTEFIRRTVDKIKPFLKKKVSLKLTLLSPPKHRDYISNVLQKVLLYKKSKISFFIPDNKCYNGCRPRKCVRKKRVGLYLRRK